MVDYIFSKYLVECKKIKKEQMVDILQKLDSTRVKLGLLAVTEGMMTLEQAVETNRLQALWDKRFGDIAVEKGYLTSVQVETLLKKQGNTWLTYVQTLVDSEIITMEELDVLLNDFKGTYGYTEQQIEDLKSDEVDRIIPLLLPEEAMKYQELICTVVRTMLRLIDRHLYVSQASMVDDLPKEDMTSQILTSKTNFVDCFSERDGALLKVCTIFGQEEFPMLNMDALDAAGELLNCVNGLYASAKSANGELLELMPPEYCMNVRQTENAENQLKDICRIPLFVGNKGLYFTVGEQV